MPFFITTCMYVIEGFFFTGKWDHISFEWVVLRFSHCGAWLSTYKKKSDFIFFQPAAFFISTILMSASIGRDILLGLVKRLVNLRASKLKILITSATLDGEKVSKFFSNCPTLNVPGKLYPVEILHSKERPTSYLESALKTAIGTIDIFVNSLCIEA